MQKIKPCLWFEDQAEEAARFYTSLFENSGLGNVLPYGEVGADVSGMPEGSVLTVDFRLAGQDFMALNGGPEFTFTPAISFAVNCESRAEVDGLWDHLIDGGSALMELGEYPFNERFGWVQDRFGLSWQLSVQKDSAPKITPFLMFVGDQCGKASEAADFYCSLFEDSGRTEESSESHEIFLLAGQQFIAMDSDFDHGFTFSEALSLLVNCGTQDEVDRLWEQLSGDGGEEGQCGWLKDRFGVSWQIVPEGMDDLLGDPDPEKSERVMAAMVKMNKIDMARLQEAHDRA